MAKFLVKLKTRAGDRNDDRMAVRPGCIVGVFRDAHVFGSSEDKREHVKRFGSADGWGGDYAVIEVPDLSYETAQKTLETHDSFKFRWWFKWSDVPQNFKNNLISNGFAVVTKSQVLNYIRDRSSDTGLPA